MLMSYTINSIIMKKLMTMLTVAGMFLFMQSSAQTRQPDSTTLNFVTSATKGGLMEVASGRLATKKAKSSNIKAFGARMIADHSKANAQLTSIVAKKGWKLPAPSATQITPDAMLANSTGAEFDRAYVNMMVKDHQHTIAVFQKGAQSADAEVKAFATGKLPVLQHHLTMIQSIAAKLGIAYDK